MTNKVEFYIEKLKTLKEWDTYLLAESGLPGPRGNLELAEAFAEIGNEKLIREYIKIKPDEAPVNSAKVFLTFCGVVRLGTLVNRGKKEYLKDIRHFASDSRWRIREAVAMALQRIGDADINLALHETKELSGGNFLEKRAASAALCEPRLLKTEIITAAVLDILNDITTSIVGLHCEKDEDFNVLKKGLGYCWSVAVVANPAKGKNLMEKWIQTKDKNVLWIMKENLKKNRLTKTDKDWVIKQAREINKTSEFAVLNIRRALLKDLDAITEIYNEAILHTVATFDTEPKTAKDQKLWFTEHDDNHPLLVAEQNGQIVGWASLTKWSDRCAYSGTAEVSLYVKKEQQGKGIGRKLLKEITEEGEEANLHTVIARVTKDNEASLHLFESEGFELIGVMREVGRKFGKLLDVCIMQRIYETK